MQTLNLGGAWQFRQSGADEWLPAQVPGGVHTDLMALGKIPDPFVGDNEKHVQWVPQADWEYRRSFDVSSDVLTQDRVYVVCDGLDTLATVILNGRTLGKTDNEFRQYRWEVKKHLKPAGNELVILFASPVKFITKKHAKRALPGSIHAIAGGQYLRKAPCQFGWDWGPQIPPIGIWKDIRLEGRTKGQMTEVHVRQRHVDRKVAVEAVVDVDSFGKVALAVEMRITAPSGEIIAVSSPITTIDKIPQAKLTALIEKPQLWWPNGYGAQPLYKVEIILRAKNGELKVCDTRQYSIGLRTVELRQESDRWGRSFQFVVNGVPIFAKGADWIPADTFPTRITRKSLEGLIRSAVDTHQNMLRVWGGGFYEDDLFYDLCDEYGILVWQDFVFACNVYPLSDDDFLENLRVEAQQNIRRLRHRASLALWCGNNEMEQGWVEWNWDRPDMQDMKAAYDLFFHWTLREWCAAEDPDTAYWPSSPSSDILFNDPNGQRQGDAHYWDVWHKRAPFTAYRDQYPRFMSEFGFQALPPLETIKTFADEADWNMTSYVMEQHQKNAGGNALMVAQMLQTFRLPKDFSALVYLSGVLQAEGIRYGVEHWRRHMDRVAGTLYWQLNDCWPVASWSSLDYYGRWKPLHYAAKKFYAPLMLSIEDRPPEQRVFITSDLQHAWQGQVKWTLETLDGKVLRAGEEAVKAAPLASAQMCSLSFADLVDGTRQREVVFVAELWQGNQRLSLQTAFFAPTKHLAIADPKIQTEVSEKDGLLSVALTAQSLARLVEVSLKGVDAVFSDNYFDLPAGRTVTVTCPLPRGWKAAKSRAALRVRSIYDSF